MWSQDIPKLFHNSLEDLVFAFGAATLLVVVLRWLQRFLERRIADVRARKDAAWLEGTQQVLHGIRLAFWIAVAIVSCARTLHLPDGLHAFLRGTAILLALLQAGISLASLSRFFVGYALRKSPNDGARVTTVRALAFLANIVLFSTLTLIGLDNFGVNVTALVAGLGVGGIAIALAAQSILGDFLASLTIVLDRPFVIGDSIIVGTDEGTVERIGMKTTRMRGLAGEEIIYPNSQLLQNRIRNMRRMFERRVQLNLAITYETSRETVKKIPEEVRAIIEAQKQARFERCHFKDFKESWLDIEIVFWIRTADGGVHLDVRQAILLELWERFEKMNASFAYPTSVQYTRPAN